MSEVTFQKVQEIFDKYKGHEISVLEEETELIPELSYTHHTLNERDNPSLDSLRAELAAANLSLRILLPGQKGTAEVQDNRVVVNVSKDDDKKWRMNSFRIG